jgi:hypothetical protein
MLGYELVVFTVVNTQNPHGLRLNSTRAIRPLLTLAANRVELPEMSPARVVLLNRTMLSIPFIDPPITILPPRSSTSVAAASLWSNAAGLGERCQIARSGDGRHSSDLPGWAGQSRSGAVAAIDRQQPVRSRRRSCLSPRRHSRRGCSAPRTKPGDPRYCRPRARWPRRRACGRCCQRTRAAASTIGSPLLRLTRSTHTASRLSPSLQ